MKTLIYTLTLILCFASCTTDNDDTTSDALIINTYLEPTNNAVCTGERIGVNAINVILSWNPFTLGNGSGITYTIAVTNLQTSVTQEFFVTGFTTTVVELETGQSYSWVITASNDNGDSVTGETWQFQTPYEAVTNYAPFPATLLTPTLGVNVNSTNVSFSWQGNDPDAGETATLTYDLYLSDTNPPSLMTSGLSAQNVTENLTPGITYYWFIKSIDVNGNASFSQTWEFTTN